MIKLAVPKEINEFEDRVSITPDCVKSINKIGFSVHVESNAGANAAFSDNDYKNAGAKIEKNLKALYKDAKIVTKVQRPSKFKKINEFSFINPSSNILGLIYPDKFKDNFNLLKKSKANVFALELMPRISRAQSMDVLSSQSNLAGYKAVIDSASMYNKAFPLMMTSAGTVAPAKILIIGAGVAGLQAVATAKRLGAVVFVFDVRTATKEQVESLGGNFIAVENQESGETKEGYAREMSASYKKKQAKLLDEHLKKMDIVITTALVPGKPAPKILSRKMVDQMKDGSIVMDLASEFGGNCDLTKHGKVIEYNSKKIVGPNNLSASVAQDASRLYSKNILNFLVNSSKDGKFTDFNWEDELVLGTCILKNGKSFKQGKGN